MNSKELAEMFKNLQVGSVFSYQYPDADEAALVVLEVHPEEFYQFGSIKEGELDSIMPYLSKWNAEAYSLDSEYVYGKRRILFKDAVISFEEELKPEFATLENVLKLHRKIYALKMEILSEHVAEVMQDLGLG